MDFFTPCWIAFSFMFKGTPSDTYLDSELKSGKMMERVRICNDVGIYARRRNIDPLLAIAISFHETRFTYVESEKGAKGPLGVIPKWHCPKDKGKKCDYIEAGMNAIDKVLEASPDDLCLSLAIYNRGFYGKCERGRPEYKYAQNVLKLYYALCSVSEMCHTC